MMADGQTPELTSGQFTWTQGGELIEVIPLNEEGVPLGEYSIEEQTARASDTATASDTARSSDTGGTWNYMLIWLLICSCGGGHGRISAVEKDVP